MSRTKRKRGGTRAQKRAHAKHAAPHAAAGMPEMLAVAGIAVLSWMQMYSVEYAFRTLAGLHRWMMTYAHGFHRRGLLGSIFQFFFGDLPVRAQIEIASGVSTFATYAWWLLALVLFFGVTLQLRDRRLRWCALAFGAAVFVNPMWPMRIFDNGYTDWLTGLAVFAALAAYAGKRPLLAGIVAAVGIVGYWGTVFVWLPLGLLIAVLLVRDACADDSDACSALQLLRKVCMSRGALAIYTPLAAAILSVVAHDNAAAVAELQRIGGQQHIIDQTFTPLGPRLAGQWHTYRDAWSPFLAVWTLYALPPLVLACCLVAAVRRCGRRLLPRAWMEYAVAAAAAQLPLTFLVPGFDWSRMMLWTYAGLFLCAVVWMRYARAVAGVPVKPVRAAAIAPLLFALFAFVTPVFYIWPDMNHEVHCRKFCALKHGPQTYLLDAYRRHFISSPIHVYESPGALTPARRAMQNENGVRIVRQGRDAAGEVMSLEVVLNDNDEGVTVRAPRQTQRAVLGKGRYRLTIRYRSEGVSAPNATTQFNMALLPSWVRPGDGVVLRAALPPAQREFSTVISAPPGMAGNLFAWKIEYNGKGVFELHHASLRKLGE